MWWNDDRDEAIAELDQGGRCAPAESELRLDLAELLEQQARPCRRRWPCRRGPAARQRDAPAARRAGAAAGGQLGRRRPRRHAAERLFGLRLDTDTQVFLSGQMHQLGLHELADAVLGRARHRAGNKAAALVGLMLQYQTQGKHDEATQVAMQVLRSSARGGQALTARTVTTPRPRRTAAIGVLARLRAAWHELIERAEAELKKTPNSVQIHQTLADYYTAARQDDKARAELAKLAELRPDDTGLRASGRQPVGTKRPDRHTPSPTTSPPSRKTRALAARAFAQIESLAAASGPAPKHLSAFRANRFALDRHCADDRPTDPGIAGGPGTDRAVRSLFRKAWDAFPDQRFQLLVLRSPRRHLADAGDV